MWKAQPMPSLRHEFLVWALPRVKGSRDLEDQSDRAAERARLEACQAGLEPRVPSVLVPRFDRDYEVTTQILTGAGVDVPCHVISPRSGTVDCTLYYVHGGGFVSPIDPFHVRYAVKLAQALDARIVMPDYPLTPTYTWRDSHAAIANDVAGWAAGGRVVLAGDSAGGGIALAVAQTLRDRGGPQPGQMLLLAPWVDLTTSTPETYELDDYDPWLFIGKMEAYAAWWAGDDDPGRPEASPVFGDLDGLPPTLLFCGTRDLLVPGCRLLVDRAAASNWDLTYLEAEGLLHVFPLLPIIPEAARAWRHTMEFLA